MHFARLCGLEAELPIFAAVHAILEGTLRPDQAQEAIMGRPARGEHSSSGGGGASSSAPVTSVGGGGGSGGSSCAAGGAEGGRGASGVALP